MVVGIFYYRCYLGCHDVVELGINIYYVPKIGGGGEGKRYYVASRIVVF